MTIKVQQNSFITPAYLEKAITCALSKTDYLTANYMRVKTVNPNVCNMADRDYFLSPDLAGCYFEYMEWNEDLASLFLSISPKQLLTYYSFQFVWDLYEYNQNSVMRYVEDNSKWANEGYIVTARLPTATEKRKAIHHSFKRSALGLIKLDTKDYKKSKVIYPARSHEAMIPLHLARVVPENDGFRELLTEVASHLKILESV